METITVRRKDNGKLKIMLPEHFDATLHEIIDEPKSKPEPAVETPKRGRKAKA